jgi:hypothetical protein
MLASGRAQPCTKDLTKSERIASRPTAAKFKSCKVQFCYTQLWDHIMVDPIFCGASTNYGTLDSAAYLNRDGGMSTERWLDIFSLQIKPTLKRRGVNTFFVDGDRAHCRPPLASTESQEIMGFILDGTDIEIAAWPQRSPDLAYWERGIFIVKCYTKKVLDEWAQRPSFKLDQAAIIIATDIVVGSINSTPRIIDQFNRAMLATFDKFVECVDSKGSAVA